MAPLPPLSRDELIARLQKASLGRTPWRFGSPPPSHAVVVEGGRYRVHVLVLDRARADAFLAKTGRFMPEDAAELSDPGKVIVDAGSLDELCAALRALPWPLR